MAYKLYDLSQPFGTGTPMWPRWLAPDILVGESAFTGITPAGHPEFPLLRGGGMGGAWIGHLHVATHIVAPIYCIDYGLTLEKIPLEKCYGTGVVLDFRNKKKWDRITAEDFEKATPKIKEGDFVVVNTGWHKYWRVNEYVYFHHYPGLVPSAAEWLIKKKVKAVAGTFAALDHPLAFPPLEKTIPHLNLEYKKETGKDPIEEFPDYEPCLTMLLEKGIICIPNAGADVDQVTGKRCTLAAFPFRLVEADAGMVRLVAIVEG
jgi:kynurenine formamidase